jgi:hypothetical protein
VDFPVADNAFWPLLSGPLDGFIVRINSDDITTASAFTIPFNGGLSLATAGQTASPIFGYASADVASGLTPSGLEILDLRSSGVLVNEVSLAAPAATTAGRFFARTSLGDTMALSIANPTSATVKVSFYFTPDDGSALETDAGQFDLPASAHTSGLLTGQPFNIPANRGGTFTFAADAPVVAAALRIDTTGINPVNSNVPIVTPDIVSNQTVGIPQFADGLGWSTQFYFVNNSDAQMDGELRLFKKNPAGGPGIPAVIGAEQGTDSVFPYSIPPRTSRVITTRGESAELVSGRAEVVAATGSNTPAAFALLSYTEQGLTRTTVPGQTPLTEFKMFVESQGTFGEPLGSTPSLAIGNASDSDAVINLELTGLDGVPSGLSGTITVPARSHVSEYLMNIPGFGSLPSPYLGVLRATTSSPGVTMAGFRCRYNERYQFMAVVTGPFPDLGAAASVIFPHLVDGGGYATQFVLIHGASGAGSSGSLRYLNQSGGALHMAILD